MILTATIGLLLLASPQVLEGPAAMFLLQATANPPAQSPSEQPHRDEASPTPPDQAEPPSQQPPSSAGGAGDLGAAQAPEQPKPKSAKPKPITPKKSPAKKAARKSPKKHSPSKTDNVVVVRNGGTSDSQGQISSGTSDQQAPEQLKNTNSLLSLTASNLQQISGRQLNPGQQDMVKQIRNYMRQSKDAAAAGDIQGANNLAVKAHLLSEELVKH
jgi:hypothetical protein